MTLCTASSVLLPASVAIDGLSIDSLEEQIGLLCGHLNAANCRLLELIGELDHREPWGAFGCKSCAHYLNWKCGIALGAAREKTRTARALRELPAIHEAFRAGRISYSKVRALTRVATPENENDLLEIAFGGTASHVETVVRHYRQMQAAEDPAAVFHSRELTCYFDDDGMLVIQGRLAADQGAIFMQAMDTLREPPDKHEIDDTYRSNAADALAQMAELALREQTGSSRTADHYQVRIGVSAETLLNQAVDYAKPGSAPAIDNGPTISLQTLQRLGCDCSVVSVIEDREGNPLSVGRKTRTVPPALRRALDRRDGGCCFPGCTQTRHLDAHHVTPWSQGGKTELANLVLLCRKHHTWLHEGGYGMQVTEGGLQFTTPRGLCIENTGDKRFSGNVSAIVDANTSSGIAIDSQTSECHWDGKPADWDHIMFVLGQRLPPPYSKGGTDNIPGITTVHSMELSCAN